MKKLLFFIISLMTASAVMADSYLYIDDFTVYNTYSLVIELPIKASFAGRVSAWELNIEYPTGITPIQGEDSFDASIAYYNEEGLIRRAFATIIHTDDFKRFQGYSSITQMGYWQDNNSDDPTAWVPYGLIKWEAGNYDEMLELTVEVSDDFTGGDIVMKTHCYSADDSRGGTVVDIGEAMIEYTRVCHITAIQEQSNDLDGALNVEGGNIHFTTIDQYPWTVVTEGTRTFALSGNAGVASSTSTLTATIEAQQNSVLSFDFKAWGEGENNVWDKCMFGIDGEWVFTYGALKNDWETFSVEIPSGTHVLTWSYSKDGSVNPTGDYFAIDEVTLRSAPARGDVDGNGDVTIADVSALIDILLNGGNYSNGADADCNGSVSIADVSALIDYLLSGRWPGHTITVGGVSFNMIPVEGGTFTMGGTAEQGSSVDDNELPTHQVTLSSYYIGETEVTQALWLAVMGSNTSQFTGDLNRPVEFVSWNECQTFISKLNQMTGMTFRLPTEAEWEYAARGGNKSRGYKYAGSNDANEVAWYLDNAGSQTHPVAQKAPNELGLYDMSGNVFEWILDNYALYSSGPQTDPISASGSDPVIRGGNITYDSSHCRVSKRWMDTASSHWNDQGLRLACSSF